MFVGKTLTNIRLLNGYTRKQLADMLQLTEQAIWQYENGYLAPKLEVVNELKRIFGVKSKYFYTDDILSQQSPEEINQNFIAYRATTLNSIQKTQYEAKHLEFINAFLKVIEQNLSFPKNHIYDLREKVIGIISDDSYERREKIIHAANYAREYLGLSNIGNSNLLFVLEKKGTFIFEKAIGEKIDAYSVWSESGRPYIILGNIKKSAVRRNFDLAHELGHLLLHYKVEFSSLDKKSYREYENEANLFAAFFLLPEKAFKADFLSLTKTSNPDSYVEMKKKWFVSIQALARHASSLDLLSYQQYRYFNMMINKKGYRIIEPLDTELKVARPGKVKSILQLLFENGRITLNSLLNTFSVDKEFLSKLLGIEDAFFNMHMVNTTKRFDITDLTLLLKENS